MSSKSHHQKQVETYSPTHPVHTLPHQRHTVNLTAHEEAQLQIKRSVVGTIFGFVVVVVTVVIFCLLYFGAVWDPSGRLSNAKVAILSEDVPVSLGGQSVCIGATLASSMAAITQPNSNKTLVGWVVLNSGTLETVSAQVDSMDYWAAIHISSTYTQSLLAAIYHGIAFTETVRFVYDEGRQFATISSIKARVMNVLSGAGDQLTKKILAGSLGSVNLTVANVGAIAAPVVYQDVNLHPVGKNGPAFTTYMVYVVLWIGTLFSVTILRGIFAKLEGFVRRAHLVLMRLFVFFLFELFIALASTIVIAAMGGTFEYGFGVFFLWSLFACLSFGSLISLVTRVWPVLGPVVCTFLMVLQVASSDAMYDQEVSPEFYYIGRGFPLYHAIHGARFLMFGSANTIWLNGMALAIYYAITSGLLLVIMNKTIKQNEGLLAQDYQIQLHEIPGRGHHHPKPLAAPLTAIDSATSITGQASRVPMKDETIADSMAATLGLN
eukprot:GILJ01011481.1.p1 GENE.GILJ01011481.1~~GILJ01011481.1.p1  ORF type:complete len:493 (-),score=56.44 GILJ01011481.1:93-1571(-)